MSTVTEDPASAVEERTQPELQRAAASDKPEIAPPPATSRREKVGVGFWWAVGSLALMVIGAFGPWVTVLGTTINGTDDSKDGWFVLGAAVIGALLLLGYAARRGRWYAIVAMLAGLASAATAAYDIADTNNVASQTSDQLVSTEWGIYLSLVGSISLALASLALLFQARRRRQKARG